MRHTYSYRSIFKGLHITSLILFFILSATLNSYGHVGKSHGGTGFSSLQAVQKATQMYDKLIVMGKLTEDWETRLVTIKVGTHNTNGKSEYIVQFKKEAGDPHSVYFFFDQKGEYTGSNFTGK